MYTLGNPVNYTDPSGNCPWCIPVVIILVGLFRGCSSTSDPEPDATPVPDIAVTQSLVGISIKSDTPYPTFGFWGLGTVVNNKRTVVTARHNLPLNKYALDETTLVIYPMDQAYSVDYNGPNVKFNDEVRLLLSEVQLKYENGRDMMTITLPQEIPGNVIPAVPDLSYEFKKGDVLMTTGTSTTADYRVNTARLTVLQSGLMQSQVEGEMVSIAIADDPTRFLHPGCSGGGVFYNGRYVGLISAVADSASGQWALINPYSLNR